MGLRKPFAAAGARTWSLGILFILIGHLIGALSQAQSWNREPDLPVGLIGHVAAVSQDATGKEWIFVLGGFDGSQAWLRNDAYDSSTGTWDSTSFAPLPAARIDSGVAVDLNGVIYVIGGRQGAADCLNSVATFDPATNTWSSTSPMSTGRCQAAAARTPAGKILVAGGITGSGIRVATVEEYDPATDAWRPRAAMPSAESGIGAALGFDGLIYAMGRNESTLAALNYRFDPVANSWTVMTPVPTTGLGGRGVTIGPNGRIYLINDGSYNTSSDPRVFSYDPSDDSWRQEPDSLWGYTSLAAASLKDRVYAIGGTVRFSPDPRRVASFGPLERRPPQPTPTITSPVPGSQLSGATVSFSWNANGLAINDWQLSAGSQPGLTDYFAGNPLGNVSSAQVTGLPTNGGQIYLRLKFLLAGTWHGVDFQFDAASTGGGPSHHSGISVGEVAYTSMAVAGDGTPWVAFQDFAHGTRLTVMKLGESGWQPVGPPGLTLGPASYVSLALDSSDVPYVAFRDGAAGNRVTVQRRLGSVWQTVGDEGFSSGAALYTSLALDSNGHPWVAFKDATQDGRATVMRFNGGVWQTVGNSGFSTDSVSHVSLALAPDGTPWIAFRRGVLAASANASAWRFDGSQWQPTADLDSAAALFTSLAIAANNDVYLAYRDDQGQASVAGFDQVSGIWSAVGKKGFSDGLVDYTSLAISDDQKLYLAYRDFAADKRASLTRFDGTWQPMELGFSTGEAQHTSLAVGDAGTAFVAYRDLAESNKATVSSLPDKMLRADLSIDGADSQITPGLSFNYPLMVENLGPNTVWDVTLAAPSVLGATWTCTATPGSSCPQVTGGNTTQEARIRVGGALSYNLSAAIDPATTGTLVDFAHLRVPSGIVDSNPDNDVVDATVVLTPQVNLVLGLTDGQDLALPGQTHTYHADLANNGPSDSPDVHVAATLPAALHQVTWTCTSSADALCGASGEGPLDDWAHIPVGGAVSYTITGVLDVSFSGSLESSITASSPLDTADASDTTQVLGNIFSDSFESGDLAAWSTNDPAGPSIIHSSPTVTESLKNARH